MADDNKKPAKIEIMTLDSQLIEQAPGFDNGYTLKINTSLPEEHKTIKIAQLLIDKGYKPNQIIKLKIYAEPVE
ncbi:MAG: hypothetical protein KKF48_00890 [Nanoarchaeota archaeon]|nr:hypothetical protein [Nanoarchaeota archaeon]MBU1027579.1 hypothetical protein [Nanoarchaeota archaeon]